MTPPNGVLAAERTRKARTRVLDALASLTIRVLASIAVLAIASIIVFIAKEALPILWEPHASTAAFSELVLPRRWPGDPSSEFVWQPIGNVPKFNVVPLFVGSLKVAAIAMTFALPMSLLAATFVAQYAKPRQREVLKPAIELLASIPGVVLGLIALSMIASTFEELFGLRFRLNALVAGCAVGLSIVPTIFTISEDAISAVPRELGAAAVALGARKHQIVLRVMLPAALPGIAAAMILGLGRALGETMIVLMASGNAAVIDLFDPTSSARSITATLASELGEVTPGDVHWRVLFSLGALLFSMTFALDRLASWVVSRLTKRWTAR